MNEPTLLGPWVRRFLVEHLIDVHNFARNTQVSYRDALILLLPWAAAQLHKSLDRLNVEDLSPALLQGFLRHLEEQRRCSLATRNQRLAAIHALARFIASHSPEHLAWCLAIRDVPFKKAPRPVMAYLDRTEIEALLHAPDQKTPLGRRDHALLLFLYNTGARADEAARLTVADLQLDRSPWVRLIGKGSKVRHCPLWSATATVLHRLVLGRPAHEPVFLNRRGQRLTRFGIHALVKRHIRQAQKQTLSLNVKRVSTHTIRHTTAVHLLRAGVDINTIRAWLGHASLDTTNIYAEVDLEMKAEALVRCDPPASATAKRWHQQPALMTFLQTLGQEQGVQVMLPHL